MVCRLPQRDRIPLDQLVANTREMAALRESGKQRLQQADKENAIQHAQMQQTLDQLRSCCWDSLAVKAVSLVGMRRAAVQVCSPKTLSDLTSYELLRGWHGTH